MANSTIAESMNITYPALMDSTMNETSSSAVGSIQSQAWGIEFIVNGVVIPSIAVCGIVGNLLNLIILSWRYNKREADVLEKGSLLGLISLTVSDMLFCIVILPHMFYYKQKTAFASRSFRMFYHKYGIYFQNVFIKTSTFLTLVVGVARYVGICHPLRARIFIGLNGMRATCIITYILWFSLMSPMLWMYSTQIYRNSNNTTIYIIDTGPFARNRDMSLTFTYIWSLTGYFIPVAVLAFCNVNLIRSLRQSMRLRQASVRRNPGKHNVSARITFTLIALIVMFMLLISPSEILHFVLEIFNKEQYRSFEVAVMCTNVLQAINFAFHFVLYCAVNVTFRKTVMSVVCSVVRRFRMNEAIGESRSRQSLQSLNGKPIRSNSCGTSVSKISDIETYA